MKGSIHSVETFGSVDGPGVRFIVFMQGCRMRCAFCHNPDTWDETADASMLIGADELFRKAFRYRTYWKGGGVTASGGEPLLQADFLTEFFSICKQNGVHTALDTAGNPYAPMGGLSPEGMDALMAVTDLVLLDIKHIDSREHKRLTGYGNENVLEMARYFSEIGKPVWIRHVLVPGINSDDEYLLALREFLDTLKNVERIEVLPYHTMGVHKWEMLGIPYRLGGVEPPSEEMTEHAREILGAY